MLLLEVFTYSLLPVYGRGRGTVHDRDAMQSRDKEAPLHLYERGLQSITEQTAQGSIFYQPLHQAHNNESAMDAEEGSWSRLIMKHHYA
jgi:hypothetical protein